MRQATSETSNDDPFFGQAIRFLATMGPVLTWMGDKKGVRLDLEKIRGATELSNVVLLATKKQIKFTDSATGTSKTLDFPDMPAALVQTLRSYLGQIGGFDFDVPLNDQRNQQVTEQHSYVAMRLTNGFLSAWLAPGTSSRCGPATLKRSRRR